MDPKQRVPAEWPEFDLISMLKRLSLAGVDYVVIGGIAMVAHGSARVTRDLDIVFAPGDSNLQRLGRALIELDARLRGVDDEVPFSPDARTLSRVDVLTLVTDDGWLDLHRRPAGAPPYSTLLARAERIELDGFSIMVAAPTDLQAMKRTAGRPQDLMDLEYLEAIVRLRRERAAPD